jgi:hypothetical protein
VQGGDQFGARGFDPVAGEIGEAVEIALTGHQGLEDGASTDTQ